MAVPSGGRPFLFENNLLAIDFHSQKKKGMSTMLIPFFYEIFFLGL